MHGLTHLVESVKDLGCLDSFSAFPFENFMQVFKKMIRKGDKPLEQVVKRLTEMMASNYCFSNNVVLDLDTPSFSRPHSCGPLLPSSDELQQYSCVQFSTFTIRTSKPNSCCFLKCGSIILIENIVFSKELQGMAIVYREFVEKSNFYSNPLLDSSTLNVFTVSKLSQLQEQPISNIEKKMILVPYEDRHVAFPMLHCL